MNNKKRSTHWEYFFIYKHFQETIYKNFRSIEFLPDKFMEYLLSPAVGFAKSEILGYPHHHHSKGFQRYIQVYTKSTMFPSERVEGPPTFAYDIAQNDNSNSYGLETESHERVSACVSDSGEDSCAFYRNGYGAECEDSRDCKVDDEKFAQDVAENFSWDNT